MSTDSTVTKTIWQYSEQLPEETMDFLKSIAVDYCKVKNYVYGRYSGIRNLNNLTPVYNILNEMRGCGLREQLNLPVVYYELAIAEAVTNIKSNWGNVKNRIGDCITENENLSDDDRIYLRTVLKLNSVYAAIGTGYRRKAAEQSPAQAYQKISDTAKIRLYGYFPRLAKRVFLQKRGNTHRMQDSAQEGLYPAEGWPHV